ncbi:hypothetical protein TorRG33x02_316420 [Trema orientale]|uniref:Uncharacterized protein n=1 Tax=Trema orientale TaxID=63057 RepID=A0A2P5BLY9_TREOI|nr:hypothetical protein TorRG33x02_316420 [Trema orientale]
MMRAKRDQIVATCTCSNTSGIIISIRISLGTSSLKNLGIGRGLTRLWAPKLARTAIPRRVKSRARALARHHAPPVARPDLEACRAHHVQVADAAGVAAFSGATASPERRDGHPEVVAVDEADVVEVLLAPEGDLGKRRRRSATSAGAEEGLVGSELEAAAGQEGLTRPGLDPGPNRVGALVVEGYGSCSGENDVVYCKGGEKLKTTYSFVKRRALCEN